MTMGLLSREEHLHKKQVKAIITFVITVSTLAVIVPHEFSGYAIYLNLIANWLWIWME